MKKSLLCVPALFFVAFSVFTGCGGGGGGNEPGGNSDSVDKILENAVSSLKNDKWDEAVAYYNSAYDKDPNNEKAIIYSALANLAKISTDPKVVALMKEHFGFTTYPNKLNALLSDEWLRKYPESIAYYYITPSGDWVEWIRKDSWMGEYYGITKDGYYIYTYDYNTGEVEFNLVSEVPRYDSTSLPGIRTPDWVKGTGSIYNEAMFSGNVFSADNWAISLLANMIDKNSSGFNGLLDDVIDGVFGASYNTAVERLKKLENKPGTRITLDPYFIEEVGLGEIFDQHDLIGWAEVNAVTSAMLLIKASLEWVQSYDLSTDLNWLKYSWKDDPDDMLNRFKAVNASSLPFNNNFLKVRAGKMANSKADYIKALEGLKASYTAIQSSDIYSQEVKNAYNTINGGFGQLITAIRNGGKFYIPNNPTKGSWPTSAANAEATIDIGKFFTEGYFSLQKIFEVDGNKPVFYLRGVKLTAADKALIDQGGTLSLKVNVSYIKAIAGIDKVGEFEYINTGLSRDAAKAVFEKYYN